MRGQAEEAGLDGHDEAGLDGHDEDGAECDGDIQKKETSPLTRRCLILTT